MAQFIKKEIVEARQYSGPRLKVVNDQLGEQTAENGDYLLGSERGKISVVSKATFEKDYEPYTPTADDEKTAAQADAIETLKGQLADIQKAKDAADALVNDLQQKNAALQATQNDAEALKQQVADLQEKLAAEQQAHTDSQSRLEKLMAIEKQAADAQAALDAAEAAKEKLG